jgi:hypothetical protein
MTEKLTEKPLDRLNYYNGQRLEASDLKLEQEYHIRVRRWLNKSLYSAGIARGLEVRAEKLTAADQNAGKKPGPRVVVSPGLALDADGHEIILWDEERLVVIGDGRHSTATGSDAVVEGMYLTIRYNEDVTAVEKDGCEIASAGAPSGGRPAWGGPTRVRAKPLFAWRTFLPPESSGEVVLALVELEGDCSAVHQIDASTRRYVGAASAAKVRQYALEGERHIDAFNPARIYFHIRGRQPNAVVLHLRSEIFSTLYYSELGKHKHDSTAAGTTGRASYVDAHMHSDPDGFTGLTAINEQHGADPIILGHSHNVIQANLVHMGNVDEGAALQGLVVAGTNIGDWGSTNGNVSVDGYPSRDIRHFGFQVDGGVHSHEVMGSIGSLTVRPDANAFPRPTAERDLHTHSTTAADAGVTDPSPAPPKPQLYTARSGAPLQFVDDLQVSIGTKIDNLKAYTTPIREQIETARPSQEDWSKLGEASNPNHPFVVNGTGAIRLDFLPSINSFTEGEYVIELWVPAKTDAAGQPVPNGGRILYNLYVE